MPSDTKRGEPASGVRLAAKTVIEASVYVKIAPFQGAFPVARQATTAMTNGPRLYLEMVHDHSPCE
jgi:hypothetical protein